uniref:Uncharacterized protein n=1 Tax=Oryza glaberrima TaxID=4538 RepID=I1NP26_ORYGL
MATEHTIDMIRDSKRTMLETEDIGVSLLQDLHQQRGRLIHAHDIFITWMITSERAEGSLGPCLPEGVVAS